MGVLMRALVLAGGGSRGSWEAGVLKYLARSGQFDEGFGFVSGTSVGAINAAGVAMFPAKDFKQAAAFVEQMWVQHINRTKDVWRLRWPWGIPSLWNPSVGIPGNLEQILTRIVDIQAIQESGVQVRFASVDMVSGQLVVHTNADLLQYGISPIMASASYPLAFTPVSVGPHWLSDGGLRDTAPVGAAIDAGADDITILTTRNPYEMDLKPQAEMKNIMQFGLRCLSLMMYEGVQSDVRIAEVYNRFGSIGATMRKHGVDEVTIAKVVSEMGADKKVVKLRVLYPSRKLHTSLDFSGDKMREQIALGEADAEALLK